MLCPANGPVDHWARRSLAGGSCAFHSLQNSHSHWCWACSASGLVGLPLSSERMCEAKPYCVDPERCLHALLCSRDICTNMGARCHEGNVVVLDGEIMKNRLLKIGIVGSIIAAICCFTPALALLLGAVGLASLTGHLDIVLLPTLVIFLSLTGYALWKRSKAQ